MSAEVFYNAASELATLTQTFSVSGVPTDPGAVTLLVRDPDLVETTYTWPTGPTITRTGTGAFTKDVSCVSTTPGVWVGIWTGTTTASDVEVVTWTTQDTGLNKLYCTPDELKSRVGIGDTDQLDAFEILAVCRSVSRWIDQHCDRRFYKRTATMTFQPCDQYLLDIPDLVSVITLKTDASGDGTYEQTWTASDYQLLPVNAAVEGEPRPYTRIKAVGAYAFPALYSGLYNTRTDRVQIAAVWGWPAVPDDVKQAASIMCGDFLKLGGMAFGVQGYGDYGAIRARMSGPAMQLLDPYRRHGMLVA